jgi:hypothetical protein
MDQYIKYVLDYKGIKISESQFNEVSKRWKAINNMKEGAKASPPSPTTDIAIQNIPRGEYNA